MRLSKYRLDDQQALRELKESYLRQGKSAREAESRAMSDLRPVGYPGNTQHAWSGEHARCSCGLSKCLVCAAIAKRARKMARAA